MLSTESSGIRHCALNRCGNGAMPKLQDIMTSFTMPVRLILQPVAGRPRLVCCSSHRSYSPTKCSAALFGERDSGVQLPFISTPHISSVWRTSCRHVGDGATQRGGPRRRCGQPETSAAMLGELSSTRAALVSRLLSRDWLMPADVALPKISTVQVGRTLDDVHIKGKLDTRCRDGWK